MKKLSLALLFLISLPAFAAAPTLQDNMKAIGKLFKTVSATVANSAQNSANAAAADQMLALFTAVRSQVPDAITSLPAASQAAAIADYQSIIDQEIANATALKADFAAGNNSAAAVVVTSMNSAKRDGHTKYNPN